DLKHYANILRLLRLIRVVKQLKQFPRVQFMVRTVSRMVNAAGDILQLLGVLLFFFSALS
ncbi:HET-E1, partial [Symbiodinium pilosum]